MPSAWQAGDVGSTKSEERRKNVKLFFLYLLSHALIYAFGMVAFHLLEGWDMGDAAYFCFVVLGTCGFGDFTPKTFWGRAVPEKGSVWQAHGGKRLSRRLL